MGVTYRSKVVLGVVFKESMIPRSFTHKTKCWVDYICTKNPKHKATGDFCSACGSLTQHKKRSREVPNEDFEEYDFEQTLVKDAPSWANAAGLFTVGSSDWDDDEAVLGLLVVEDGDIVESDSNLRPFEVTAQHWTDAINWLRAHNIDEKPQLFLVSSCG